MQTFINLFADDTSIQQPIIDITPFDKVDRDLKRLKLFGEQLLILFNIIKRSI